MNLILQSLVADQTTLHQLAALAQPAGIIELAPGVLCCADVADNPDLRETLVKRALQAQVDVHWKSVERKLSDFKLLAMDMDSTLITIECIDEIADMQGLKPQVAAITESAMRGEIAFAESLTRRVLRKNLSCSTRNWWKSEIQE